MPGSSVAAPVDMDSCQLHGMKIAVNEVMAIPATMGTIVDLVGDRRYYRVSLHSHAVSLNCNLLSYPNLFFKSAISSCCLL